MSINVYLKGEEVKKIEGFETIEWTEEGEKKERYRLPGRIDLFHSNGRWYITLDRLIEPIPRVVIEIVEEISFWGFLAKSQASREAGLYRYNSAEAELTVNIQDLMRVEIYGKEKKDLLELLRKIRIGSIRPEESYEGEQSGLSWKELEAQLKEAKESAEELGREYDRFRKLLEEAEDRITKLSPLEDEGLWAFLRRKFRKSSES